MSGPDDRLIAWLGEAPDPGVLGGKGASLDRLIRMGFRVPPGFCLTTRAFRAQCAALPAASTGGAAGEDVAAWAATLATTKLTPAVDAALSAALARLSARLQATEAFAPTFAVRSSAIGEDGSVASYAGLHETELDLPAEEVAGAVARCWASLWSPAALAYRRRQGIAAGDAAMAVVVQALVPADVAAVVFTRHPVTDREDQLVVTAVHGLGDEMVAGTVTPDTYVVDKATGTTLELERGEHPLGPALDAQALAGLVDLALAVEQRFGAAVDIEAAASRGTWFLLQARPITTGAVVRA